MQVIRGSVISPPRIVLYGEDKIGKSTWAASADSPLFIPTEDGVDEIGPDRLPRVETFDEFKKSLAWAKTSPDHATVVVDNLSGLEVLIHAHVCKLGGVASIEDFGFGKGYGKAEEVWANEVLPALDACRNAGKCVIVLAHNQIRRAEDPDTEPYDQFTLDLHKNASALFRRWADVIAFAARAVKIEETDVGFNKKIKRAVNAGDRRVIHLVGSPSHVAGNRYGLPASIPMKREGGFVEFVEAMTKRVVKGSVAAVVENGMKEGAAK